MAKKVKKLSCEAGFANIPRFESVGISIMKCLTQRQIILALSLLVK